jgi:hypothetical protein
MIDKLLHAETTALIVIAGSIVHPILGIILAVFASLGKELYDWCKYGKMMGWDEFRKLFFGDLISDGIGIIMGVILVLGVRYGIF